MKIGLTCYPTSGGSGIVAAELGRALARRGHEVHFICYAEPFRYPREVDRVVYHRLAIPQYPLYEYPSYGMAVACWMVEVARAVSLDLFHVHYAYPHAVSGFLARQILGPSAPRLVTTLHGTDVTLAGQDAAFTALIRLGIERSDGVTTVSRFLAAETRERLGVTRPIEVIPNFINPDVFSPARRDPARRRAWARDDERLVVHVSNYRPVKRVLDTVEAFARLAAEVPARLLLAGTGPDLPAAVRRAAERGIGDRVTVLGEARDIQDVIAQGDLLMLTSEREGFGLVALEAMACGVPVVATRCGGIEEVVADGEDGFLVPVGDVAALAARSAEILADPGRLCRMGGAGRARSAVEYHADRIVPRYEAVYEAVLRGA
jgi:N-acetyl-alpha-D-glucosaminyl L-malate synthase BshA